MHSLLIFLSATCVFAYVHVEKESILPGMLLEELAERMRKESDMPFLDMAGSNVLGSRSLEEEQYDPIDYDVGDAPLHPSIRDQEYLRHSSLWGSKYANGGGEEGEGRQQHKQGETKVAKNALPAYCNPPNPCPVGYTGEHGCLVYFENTAAFSRTFQDAQDCMCDTEHMFDCLDNTDPFLEVSLDSLDSLEDFDFDKFVPPELQGLKNSHQKNLVAKKFYKDGFPNPFLTGERLPVAAKKGNSAL